MDVNSVLAFAGNILYAMQALIALYGAYIIILLFRRIRQKRFASPARAAEFLEQVRGFLQQKQFDRVAELCDSPPYWSKAVPQLILVALANRTRELSKIRRMLA